MNPFGVERRSQRTLWDVRDVAQYLKASVSWVYKAAERRELPCMRVGGLLRFDPAAVRAFALGTSESSDSMQGQSSKRG
jgi:excisionase family DNA binding protein